MSTHAPTTDPARADGHAPGADAAHHVMPLRTYFLVFGALMVLTGITTAIAYVDLGHLNTPVALTIACSKCLLVILWFMHVRYSGRLIQLFAAAGFLWLLILFAFMLSDTVTRGQVEGWEESQAAPAAHGSAER